MSTEANTQEACIPIILEFLFLLETTVTTVRRDRTNKKTKKKSGMFYNANVKDKWLVHPEDNAIV